MTSFTTLHVFRAPFLATRPLIAAPRQSSGNPAASAAAAGKRDRAARQFVHVLLRSFSSWAA